MKSSEIPVVVAEASSASVVVVVMASSVVDLAIAELMATTFADVAEMAVVAETGTFAAVGKSFAVVAAETSLVVAGVTSFVVVVVATSFDVVDAEQTFAEILQGCFAPFVVLVGETLVADAEIAEQETLVAVSTLDDPVVDVDVAEDAAFVVVWVEIGPSFVAHACKVQMKKIVVKKSWIQTKKVINNHLFPREEFSNFSKCMMPS